MPPELSMAAIVERLEAQIELHREREAFHAEKEAHHRDQRAVHAAELETLTTNLAAFKDSAAKAAELARREVALPPAPRPVPSQDVGYNPSLTKMVKRIVEIKSPNDVFGPAARLHHAERVEEWLTQVIRERVELEETAFAEAKREIAGGSGRPPDPERRSSR
jgi:hypothetical protein